MAVNKFPFMVAMQESLENNLFTINTQREKAVVAELMDWFNDEARLKPMPNLPQRLVDMERKLRVMAHNLKVSFSAGKLVIKSDADSEALLSLLRRGSDWYEPHPNVDAAIMAGLMSGSQIS